MTTVTPETLERVKREEAALLAGAPGAEGTRRALEDNAAKWAAEFDQEVARLGLAIQRASDQAAFWHRIEAAATPCGDGPSTVA